MLYPSYGHYLFPIKQELRKRRYKCTDYIVKAAKPNTAVLLKEIDKQGDRFKLVLRLKINDDPEGYKNSVLTFLRIGEKTWRKTLKNKLILYSRE